MPLTFIRRRASAPGPLSGQHGRRGVSLVCGCCGCGGRSGRACCSGTRTRTWWSAVVVRWRLTTQVVGTGVVVGWNGTAAAGPRGGRSPGARSGCRRCWNVLVRYRTGRFAWLCCGEGTTTLQVRILCYRFGVLKKKKTNHKLAGYVVKNQRWRWKTKRQFSSVTPVTRFIGDAFQFPAPPFVVRIKSEVPT